MKSQTVYNNSNLAEKFAEFGLYDPQAFYQKYYWKTMKIHSYSKSPPSLHAITLIWQTSVSLSFASPVSETDCAKLDSVIQTTNTYFVCWVD